MNDKAKVAFELERWADRINVRFRSEKEREDFIESATKRIVERGNDNDA